MGKGATSCSKAVRSCCGAVGVSMLTCGLEESMHNVLVHCFLNFSDNGTLLVVEDTEFYTTSKIGK
jgi:hypothetical protein